MARKLRVFRHERLYHFRGEKWRQALARTEPYEMVIVGALVRSYTDPWQRETDCLGEWQPDGRTYRIDDGHLPDHQPRVPADQLPHLMGPHAIRFAYPV